MQKAETNALDSEKVKKQPKIGKLIEIAIDENNLVYVNWPVDKKELCITALAEAIKLVGTHQQKVIVPDRPKIMDFVRGKKS